MKDSISLSILLARVFAPGCSVVRSQFRKTSHTVDESNGDQVILIEYRFGLPRVIPVGEYKSSEKSGKNAQRKSVFESLLADVCRSLG